MSWLLAILSFLQFIHQRCTGSFGRSQLSRRASQRTTQNVHTVLRDGAGRRYMANWMARVTEGSGFEFRRLFFMASRQRRTEGGWGGVHPLPPKFRRPTKIVPNSTRLRKVLKTSSTSWTETFILITSCKTAPVNRYHPHPAEPEQHTKCSNRAFVLLKMGIMMPETCSDRS